ncbi:PepSY domain-containing protein [Sinorhizobium numidicum]|uniref:PepSY domain-containing protein n=1 Tax=Sinorhizobium numidicum TaxID=680248 RepID=A0ABY8D381_9HYPH|nr:PepSY domain-containing protein [Sinorhizobium numidicum]WEX77513.1 PepSY domain-containing protein [Sinorhizobium numidicum]WEX84173.1 PepSY domain-containing protein [Sinorhizobium numidicum]
MKNTIFGVAVLVSAAAMPALAQTASPSGNTPAIATPGTQNPAAPVAGENSFTEDQAKKRIEEAGYTDVKGLKLDHQGVWRATAMKDGESVSVALDFQGNITAL